MSAVIFDTRQDVAGWHDALAAFPKTCQDVYFLPEYIRLFTTAGEGGAKFFVYRDGEQAWGNAVLIRPATEAAETPQDVETAYGYGGPISSSDDPEFLANAHAAYNDWLASAGVMVEFMRLHPLLQNGKWCSPDMTVEAVSKTLSIGLAQAPIFKGRANNSCKRAWSQGVEVQEFAVCSHMDQFREMYLKNMEAVGADPFYFFDDAHFDGLAQLIETHGFLLAAVYEGKWLASSLFMQGKTDLHYHLSAADFDARVPGSVNTLLHAAATRGHKAGFRCLHLGGGRTKAEDDSLFFFKKSMATDEHVFSIGKRVVDAGAYGAVCAQWRSEYPDLVEKFGERILCYRHGK